MENESRTSSSIKNIKVGIINRFITIGLNLVSRRLFIDFIGIDFLGINGLFSEILVLLSLADLGFGTAMAYSFYKPLAEKDEDKLAALISFYRKVYNIIALAIAVLGICLIPFLDKIIHVDRDIEHLSLYYIICLANTVTSYLFVYKSSIIAAGQKRYIISQYQVYINIAKTVVQMIIVVVTHNYLMFLIVGIAATIANNLLISYKATKLYPSIKKRKSLSKNERIGIFGNLKSVFLYKLSSSLIGSTDSTLISMICGTVFVGYYANYITIVGNVTGIIGILFSSLTASIGNLIVVGNENERYTVFRCMQMVSYILSIVMITCMAVLMNDFIVIWLQSSEYLLNNLTLIAILINAYMAVVLHPLWSYREATGMYRKTRYIMVVAAIINLILSIILGKLFGIGGILMATAIAKISTYVWYEPKLLFEVYFKRKAAIYYISQFQNIILALLSIGIALICTSFIKNISIINWCIKAVISIFIAVVICAIRYSKTTEFHTLVKRFVKK